MRSFTIALIIINKIIWVKMINTPDGTSNIADIESPIIQPINPIRIDKPIILEKLEVNRLAVI